MRSAAAFRDGTVIIDPDELFAELGSWKAVLAKVDATLARRGDLVLETTLAGKTVLQRIRSARANGYAVTLIFIGTSNATLNIGRIATRTYTGGHAISTVDVRRRWSVTLEHLPIGIGIADRALLFDNSSSTQPFVFAAEIVRGVVLRRADSIPDWAEQALQRFH
jgi:predicted ABC-type ATPase